MIEREAKALTRALAPYRSGRQGELRAQVRGTLIRLMGFAEHEIEVFFPVGIRKIPHWFPGRSGLTPEEQSDLAAVAHDALLELSYSAAAAVLMHQFGNIEVSAKNALEILEGGPPSVMIDRYPIITKSIRRYKTPSSGSEYLVGRNVGDPRWWYRFLRGKAVHDQRGKWVGWDNETGYSFQRRGNTLVDVLAAQYGSVALTKQTEVRHEDADHDRG